jgi:hypothetical protein
MSLFRALALTTTFAIALGATTVAEAGPPRGPEKVFAGKVILSDKRFPTYAKSASAYTSAIRRQSKLNFQEDRTNQSWKIHFAAFLKSPLDDLEIIVKLYDLSGGSKALLTSFEQFTDTRGQRTIISSIKLERKSVGVNKDILIVMEHRGRTMASGRFRILGQAERYSGKVTFSEDEAKNGGDEDEEGN